MGFRPSCLFILVVWCFASKATLQADGQQVESTDQDVTPARSDRTTSVNVDGAKTVSTESVAGVPAPSSEAPPFVVFLRNSSDGRYLCGGVLVGQRHVLTVAGCLQNQPLPEVVVGSIDLTKTSGPGIQVIGASEVVFHPSFFNDGNPNLAIVKLNLNVRDLKPVRIGFRQRFRVREGESLDMLGWGRMNPFSTNAEILQIANVPNIPETRCSLALRRSIAKYEICMGGEGAGSCNGSDGGPILWRDRLVGIIGQDHVCGQVGSLDVHILTTPYSNWIWRVIRS